MSDLIAEARAELSQKSRSQIEEETAFKWGSRAVAAYGFYRQTHEPRWLRDAETYFSEGVEHASLADDSGEVLRAVHEWMQQYIPRGAL